MTAPSAARPQLPASLGRILRVLHAVSRSLRTREVAFLASQDDFAAARRLPAEQAVNEVRRLCVVAGGRLTALRGLQLVERVTVEWGHEVFHPWQLTADGRVVAATLPGWLVTPDRLRMASEVVV